MTRHRVYVPDFLRGEDGTAHCDRCGRRWGEESLKPCIECNADLCDYCRDYHNCLHKADAIGPQHERDGHDNR